MLSPPLSERLHLPAEQYDERWVFERQDDAERLPAYEWFVNHYGWTLRSRAEIEAEYGPTRGRNGLDWLQPLHARFWSLVSAHRPFAYIGNGDRFVIAARDRPFIEALAEMDA